MSQHAILVGGGLANCLIALRLAESRPEVRLTLVERDETLAGNHTWSYHDSDFSAAQRRFVEPLVTASWEEHEVRFPAYRRRLKGAYRSISSQRLGREVREAIRAAGSGHRLVTGEARWLGPDAVTLADGRRLEGQVVIDGRGADAEAGVNFEIAYQKFVGLEVELEQDHGLAAPILMDATVEQLDGYRFVYVLPFGPRRMLIEDTRYSDRPDLQPVEIRRAIDAYAGSHGWAIRRLVREEDGVLPIVLGGDIEAHWLDGEGVPRSGLRAMLFHPTTGYSLADAVDLAERIASEERLDSENILRVSRELSIAKWRRRSFFRRLNRMMFLAAEPGDRFRVLERFYRLPLGLTQRFYAGRLTWWDKIRLLAGRPPVSLRRALANFAESVVG